MQALPAEVVANILEYIDGDSEKQALKNVRRTCWALAHAAAPYLFRKASVWLERDSLKRLVNYSEHPLYSQCITQISIGMDRLNPYIYNQLGAPYLFGWSPYPWNARDIKSLYERANASVDLEYARSYPVEHPTLRARNLVEHLEYQKRLEVEGMDIVVLSTAMKNLPRLARIVFDAGYRPPESNQLAMEGFAIVEPGPAWRRHVLQVVMQALVQAGVAPRSILVNKGSKEDHYTPVWAFNDISMIIPNTHLRALVHNLRLFHFDGNSNELAEDFIDTLRAGALGLFLENAVQLEELSLSVPCMVAKDRLRSFVGQVPFRNLRKVTMSDMLFCDTDLLAWLSVHSTTLTNIQLNCVILIGGYWDDFLDSLRTKPWPNLSSFNIIDASTSDAHGASECWGWEYGSAPLVDYLQRRGDTNPYHLYHPGWFPELFAPPLDGPNLSYPA